MKNKFILLPAVIALVFMGSFSIAPKASADCSYNGYYHSNGRCDKTNKYERKYRDDSYTYTYQTQYQPQTNALYLQQYIRQLQALLEQLQRLQSSNTYYPYYETGNSKVDVTTRSATNIGDTKVTLRGQVDFNNQSEATVYFVWGKSSSNLPYETTNVVLDDNNDDNFEQTITGLKNDTVYYYRAVAEDQNGRRTYGSVLSVRTHEYGSNNNGDKPTVNTSSARNITDDSAEFRGDVDMNDFNNGDVFFVYGEDQSQVRDVEDDFNTYSDVDEDGDNLQKIRVDSDLDGSSSFWANVSGLNNDTRIYFSICVAYEDDNNDDVIKCGSVEDFRTDN